MNPIRLKIRVESEVLYLPQLKEMIGREVMITLEDPWCRAAPEQLRFDHPHPGTVRAGHARQDDELTWDVGGEGGE